MPGAAICHRTPAIEVVVVTTARAWSASSGVIADSVSAVRSTSAIAPFLNVRTVSVETLRSRFGGVCASRSQNSGRATSDWDSSGGDRVGSLVPLLGGVVGAGGGLLEADACLGRPVAPGGGGQAQEDVLARFEVAQHRGLVHADLVGDRGHGHLPYALRRGEVCRRGEDLGLPGGFGLGTAGPQETSSGHPVVLDVTDRSAAAAGLRAVLDRGGRVDVVVNNAGYANASAVETTPEDNFRRQFDTNFWGVYNVSTEALPVLRAQGGGTIVQFSSIGGRAVGTPGLGSCQAAKYAAEGFTRVPAAETAPFGVRRSTTTGEPQGGPVGTLV